MSTGGWDQPGPAAGGSEGAAAGRRDEVRQALVDLVRDRPEVVDDDERLDGYLRDICPLQPGEVSVVVVAARAGVPGELARAPEGHGVEAVAARLANRLNAESGIDQAIARWAVDTWAAALGRVSPAAPRGFEAEPVPPAPRTPPPPESDDAIRAMLAQVPSPAPPPPAAPAPPPSPPPSGPAAPPPSPPVPPAPAPPAPDRTRARQPAPSAPPAAAPPSAPPARRSRRGPLVAAVVAGVALLIAGIVVATSGDDPENVTSGTSPTTEAPTTPTEPTTTVAPQPLPARNAAIPPGFSITNTFQPRFTATFDEGWKLRFEFADEIEFGSSADAPEVLSVVRTARPLRHDQTFPSLEEARQPSSTEAPATDPVAWLRSNSTLTVSPSTPATKAGRRGVQVDVTVRGYPTNYCNDIPCAPLFRIGDNAVFTLAEGNTNRVYAITVGAAQVLIIIEAPPDRFAAFSEKAERVIASMAFQG